VTTEAALRSSVRRGWCTHRCCIILGLFLGRQTFSNLFQRLFPPNNHLFSSLIDNTLSVTALSENNSKQLCTTQFGRFFATARIPRIGRDEIKTVDLSRHIVVICRNQFFSGKKLKEKKCLFLTLFVFPNLFYFHHQSSSFNRFKSNLSLNPLNQSINHRCHQHQSISIIINHRHHHHHHQTISINRSINQIINQSNHSINQIIQSIKYYQSNHSINQSINQSNPSFNSIKSFAALLCCSDRSGREVSHSSSSSNAHALAPGDPTARFRQRGPRSAALLEIPGEKKRTWS
jgi:hypothetical protein